MLTIWSNRLSLDVVEAMRISSVRQGRDQREIVEEALLRALPPEDVAEGRRIAEMKEVRARDAGPGRGSSRVVNKLRDIPGSKRHSGGDMPS